MQGKLVAALALVTGVIALSVGSPLLLRLTYMLVGALLLAGAITFSATRWLDISRTTRARRAEVGGIAEETIRVTNRGWLPKLWLEIRDGSDLPGHRAGRVLGALGPSRTASWSARTICSRRGQFHLGPLTLVGGDPLGLFEAKRELGTTLTFTVYPKTLDLRAVDLASGFLGGGQVVRRRADFTTSNVRSVRAYQPGDSLSRIHWPTTARRRALFTKEYELDPIADVWIVLDMEESVHVGRSELDALEDETPFPEPWLHPPDQQLPPTTEEYAVTAAASLARHFLDAGKAVGLVTHAQRRLVLSPDRGERQLHKILAALAVARAAAARWPTSSRSSPTSSAVMPDCAPSRRPPASDG